MNNFLNSKFFQEFIFRLLLELLFVVLLSALGDDIILVLLAGDLLCCKHP